MEIGMISVDKWRSGSQAYFLTHLHSDHTAGLSSTWKWGPLFCSRLTAKLLPCKFPDLDLSLLRVLDTGTWHSLSLTLPSSGEPAVIDVMAIDAGHCPGSVMYLFRGEFGCMLHTGDFRWEKPGSGAESRRTMLLDVLKNEKLDILHLDNTYCNPRYSFPSREDAACQIVNIITSHPKHQIVIGIDSLGKEDLLLHLSRELNTKICVWPERLQIMHLLGFHDNFTTKTSLTRVRAVPRYSFSIETLEGLNTLCPTIGIMPSGLAWAAKAVKGNGNLFGSSPSSSCFSTVNLSPDALKYSKNHNMIGVERYHEYIYTVPYSDHSCFTEIREFIELLRPINIKGTVSSSPICIDPLNYFGHLCGTQQAYWRVHQNLDNGDGDGVERCEAAEVKLEQSTKSLTGKKRKIDQVEFFGVRISRVSLLRRLSRGVRITDNEKVK